MMVVHGKWKDGRVVFDESVDWPDGCDVEVRPLTGNPLDSDDGQPNDSEAIAQWIAEFQSIPSLEFTPEEEVEWAAARQTQRELELKTFDQRADQLQQALK